MAKHGGARKSAGRRPGPPNPKKELLSAARMSGLLPAAMMLESARKLYELANQALADKDHGPGSVKHLSLLRMAVDVAAQAAPYFDYRLSALKVERPPIDLSKLSEKELVELLALYDRAAAKAVDRDGAAATTH